MKFNRRFYQTNSFLFGIVLIVAPVYNLLTSSDPVGWVLNTACQGLGLIFLATSFVKRER